MIKERLKRFLYFSFVNNLWNKSKMLYGFMHKGVTASKACVYYVKWWLLKRKKLYYKMNAIGIININGFRPLRWKRGVKYFMGDFYGEKVFVKTAGLINTVAREASAIKYIQSSSSILKEHIPCIYYAGDYIVETYVKGKNLNEFKNTDCDDIIEQLFAIYKELKKYKILHLDIRPDNFIVDKCGTVFLLDFGFALVNNKDLYCGISKTSASQDILKNLGSNYAPHNGTVDDAYSMLLTMKYVCPSLIRKYYNIWLELNQDIGTYAVEIQ